jgi:hypothetical protein
MYIITLKEFGDYLKVSQKVKTAVVQAYYTQHHKIVNAFPVSLHRYTISSVLGQFSA